MSYLVSSEPNPWGCRIRVRASVAQARTIARELAMYAGHSYVFDGSGIIAKYLRRSHNPQLRGSYVVEVKIKTKV